MSPKSKTLINKPITIVFTLNLLYINGMGTLPSFDEMSI